MLSTHSWQQLPTNGSNTTHLGFSWITQNHSVLRLTQNHLQMRDLRLTQNQCHRGPSLQGGFWTGSPTTEPAHSTAHSSRENQHLQSQRSPSNVIVPPHSSASTCQWQLNQHNPPGPRVPMWTPLQWPQVGIGHHHEHLPHLLVAPDGDLTPSEHLLRLVVASSIYFVSWWHLACWPG